MDTSEVNALSAPGHDVRWDFDGLRLTCFSPECKTATFVRYSYMSAERAQKEAKAFFAEHPPAATTLKSADNPALERPLADFTG